MYIVGTYKEESVLHSFVRDAVVEQNVTSFTLLLINLRELEIKTRLIFVT